MFRWVEDVLAGLDLDQHSFKTVWEEVTRDITAVALATASRRWYQRCQQCIEIGGGHVEESLETNILLTMTVAELVMQFEYTSYFYLRKKVGTMEGGATRGRTALVYYWIHSSLYTGTVQGRYSTPNWFDRQPGVYPGLHSA